MNVSDIISIIENDAPLPAAAPWDASGVQVAALRKAASKIAVMLDPTLSSLTHAAESGADFVLAHHPLSMKPRFPNRQDEYLSILSLLLRNDMWLYSAHTSLDANPQGPVRWLGEKLGLEDVRILEPDASGAYGFGFVGKLPAPLSYEQFCPALAKALGRPEWQVCGPQPRTVSTVACCPGSGGSMLEAAIAQGADVFITGDVKYHIALEAQSSGLRIMDVGHFILEEEMMRLFCAALERQLDIPVVFIESRDPIAPERPSVP